MFHVTECTFFTRLELRVQEIDKMTQFRPRWIPYTTIAEVKNIQNYVTPRDIPHFNAF